MPLIGRIGTIGGLAPTGSVPGIKLGFLVICIWGFAGIF
jgi:hypothetical protein